MSKGKILFTSFYNLDDIDLSEYEKKLHITLYINKGKRIDFIHVPGLAPSEHLFRKAMYCWQKLKFTKEEKAKLYNGKTGTWFDLYEEIFLEETNRREFKIAYNRLKELLDNGVNIIAVCYCKDYRYCHRSILAKMLKEEGYNVILN